MSGYNIKDLIQEAQFRWLRPGEVLFILQNYEESQLNQQPPQKPPSSSLFLFNKRVLRFFRKDGHSWRRKKDGKNVGEAHERLKVGNVEALNCYYAHGEENPNFQRRCYWMLDSAMDHIVLVHYRDITIGKHSAGPISTLALESNIILSSNSYAARLTLSAAASEFNEPHYGTSASSSIEVNPDVSKSNGESHLNLTERIEEIDGSPELQIDQALRRLEEQLSLDHLKDIDPIYSENGYPDDLEFTINEPNYNGEGLQLQYSSDEYVSLQYPVHEQLLTSKSCANEYGSLTQFQQLPTDEFTVPNQQPLIWKDMLTYNVDATCDGSLQNYAYPSDRNEGLSPGPRSDTGEVQAMKPLSGNTGATSILGSHELEDSTFSAFIPARNMYESDVDLYSTLFDQGQVETPLASDSSLTIAEEQKFIIREICPEWGYVTKPTKVLIVGTFTCDPSDSEWICMFGDTEVPVEIIQEGVICCHAPPRSPGKVTICITSGNRVACSEVREFEYRDKSSMYMHTNSTEDESSKSSEELLLLVRFVQMLLSDKIGKGTKIDLLEISMVGEDSWAQIIEALSDDKMESYKTTDWLLEELLKDKLQCWVSSKLQDKNTFPGLSKREQGIIHMVSGLGFVWALAPILKSGVGINFRDVNGWTALHWASRFGREKMVAELLASGAYAGAVTDPCQQDPIGKTPASIAATYGHKGLAGYLSEVALTSHLSSLTLKESELSKCSADVEAERTVNSISNPDLVNEDQLSFKDAIAAVRNSSQAASRIQAAFRAHSFRKRKQKESAEYGSADEYGILPGDIDGLSAASKLAFGNARDYRAALFIQKKYRGWKGRKDFLALRQKVVKIQAHVRGHQARRKYETICWAVGIVEKIILRWHRKGVGLRGFHLDSIDGNEDEEDIVKVFRKQRVDVALSEAVSRVLSMVNSTQARQQYRRMLQKYQQAKAKRGGLENDGASMSQQDVAAAAAAGMETEDLFDLI